MACGDWGLSFSLALAQPQDACMLWIDAGGRPGQDAWQLLSVFKISAKFRPPPKFVNFGNNNLKLFKIIFKNSLK